MKKFFLSIVSIATLGFATSCSSDDDNTTIDDDGGPQGEIIVKSGIITADETWTPENVYVLDGKVVVDENVTLTIEAGTIVKGDQGQETLASALIVDQGGRLIADGTASQPIIFTSILDNIQPGETAGTNLTIDDNGLWGGVIVLGRAPISVSGDVQTAQIEGIPANEPFGQYGGNVANDNSGILRYISIRHGGITIGQDNEINGLTLGGVGSGTIIDNIEVVANQDDGIEWFGGTVNSSNLLVWGCGDDGFDADQAYSGTISNGLVIQGATSGTGLELDGPEGSAATEDSFTMNNITIIGGGISSRTADLRDGLLANLNNVLVYDISATSTIRISGEDSQNEFINGRLTFSNWEIVLPAGVANVADLLEDAPEGFENLFLDNVSVIASPANATVGANLNVFSWTYASQQNAF